MGYFSNGTESLDYAARYCDHCVHVGDDTHGCAVWHAHMLFNYADCNKPESILHLLIPRNASGGNEACRLFLEKH